MGNRFKNVWDALFDDSGEKAVCEAKSKLMIKIEDYIKENQLTQDDAAELMGITQPRVSNMINGRISKFTIDALVNALAKVGIKIEITFSDEQPQHVGFVNWKQFAVDDDSRSDDYPVQHIGDGTITARELPYECELAA